MSKLRRTLLVSAVIVLLVVLALPVAASAAPSQTAGGSGCALFHKVKPGENLFRIAMRYGTTVHKLAALNGISNPDFILAGSTLCVKPVTTSPKPPPQDDDGFWYTVKKGDTLGNIGSRYGWGALTLARVNGIKNPDLIYPGQKLWIPDHD
jgi:LysM repeat protein